MQRGRDQPGVVIRVGRGHPFGGCVGLRYVPACRGRFAGCWQASSGAVGKQAAAGNGEGE